MWFMRLQRTEEVDRMSCMKMRRREVSRHNAHAVYLLGLERATDRTEGEGKLRGRARGGEMGGALRWRPTRVWLTLVAPPSYNHRTVARQCTPILYTIF